MAEIKTMRRGSLSEWTYDKTLKDGTVKQRGPFFRITRKDGNNKTVTTPVQKASLDYFRKEVDNYRKFRKLADEYAEVCEQISVLAYADDDAKKN
jgi:hypothetical protein